MADLNENKPGYKKTKVGWIPEEWECISIEDIANLRSGQHLSKNDYSEAPAPNVDIPYFTGPTDIVTEIDSVAKWAYPNKKIANKGNLLITVKGSGAGRVDLMELDKAILGRQLMALSAKNHSNLFIYYWLKKKGDRLAVLSFGNMIPGLSRRDILTFKLPLPPLPEQRQIATLLSTWDTAIDKLGQLIAKKQALKKGLMQQLLSGRVRFPEFVPPGGTKYKETKVGWVPEDWEVVRIKDVVKEVKRDFNWDDESKYDLISIRRRSGGVFYRDSLYGHQIKTKTLKPVHEGDFLISKMQIVHGASGLVSPEHHGMMASASYIIMRTKKENRLDIRFLDLLSRLPWFYHLTYLSSHGVHIEKMTFDFKDFLKRSIYLPPITEQIRIIECIYSSEKEIKTLQEEHDRLQTQKKGLMQQLLTGAVRVAGQGA